MKKIFLLSLFIISFTTCTMLRQGLFTLVIGDYTITEKGKKIFSDTLNKEFLDHTKLFINRDNGDIKIQKEIYFFLQELKEKNLAIYQYTSGQSQQYKKLYLGAQLTKTNIIFYNINSTNTNQIIYTNGIIIGTNLYSSI